MEASSTKLTSLIINGESKFISCNCSILNLLDSYKINKDRVVIELNKQILKKEEFAKTVLKENDKIEIITFVGGG